MFVKDTAKIYVWIKETKNIKNKLTFFFLINIFTKIIKLKKVRANSKNRKN